MKNTINLGANKRIVTSPIASIKVEIQERDEITQDWKRSYAMVLEEHQAGALISGMEYTFDAMARHERAREIAGAAA